MPILLDWSWSLMFAHMQNHRRFQREIRKFMDEYVYPDAQVRLTLFEHSMRSSPVSS